MNDPPGSGRDQDRLVVEAGASLFHRTGFRRLLGEVFRLRDTTIEVTRRDGSLSAFLPLVARPFPSRQQVCLPLAPVAGPVGSPEGRDEALNLAVKAGGPLEVRAACERPALRAVPGYSTFLLDLARPDEALLASFKRKSVRHEIGKSSPTEVRLDRSPVAVRGFTAINARVKQQLGSPAHPRAWFDGLREWLKDDFRLYTAWVDGAMVGGAIVLVDSGTWLYAYGACRADAMAARPYHALIWQAIRDANAAGARHFDFGRTHAKQAGLTSFKAHWGTRQVPTPYSVRAGARHSMHSARESRMQRALSGAVRLVPARLHMALSLPAMRYLG